MTIKLKNDENEYYIRDMRIHSDHSPYKTKKEEPSIDILHQLFVPSSFARQPQRGVRELYRTLLVQ